MRLARRPGRLLSGFAIVGGACALWLSAAPESNPASAASSSISDRTPATGVRKEPVVRTLRVAGTVEAVRAFSVMAPRLMGQPAMGSLVITRLVPGGTRVRAGDVLVEFDRQDQNRNARDKRAEFLDLKEQIRKRGAEQAVARAHDETELEQADNDVGRARLDVQKNELVARIEAEKNTLALEQADARLKQLRQTFTLKRRAADADLRILEIRRDRARNEMRHAERNAGRMTVAAPFDGLAVLRAVFRPGGQMTEVQEGEEIRAGMPIVDVVDSSAMQVRARVNQVDVGLVAAGQRVRVQLDAYPELTFDGRVEQVAPIAVLSTLTPKVRAFVTIISIAGTHPKLMPDLSAAVDIEVQR